MARTLTALTLVFALGLLGTAPQARAAAFALYEHGAGGLGNAYAGSAAVAEDASTVWWNPAGMARLAPGKHLTTAGFLIAPSIDFSDEGSMAATLQGPGGTGGNAGEAAFIPNVFFAMGLDAHWNFGVGVSVPFGLSTEYDSDWIGRFQGISSEVKTVNVNPSLSYKFSERASIGGGISYQRGEIDLLTAANYSAAAFAAGGAGLLAAIGGPGVEGQNTTGVDGDAWGFNVGVLFDLTPATRVGIHYRSALKYKLEGTTSFSNVPAALAASPSLAAGDVELELKTPDSLTLGAAHALNDRWELLGTLMWWNWSRVKQVPLVRTDGSLSGSTLDTFTFNFKDTMLYSVGANYRLNDAWMLKMGVGYDQSPVPSAELRSVRLPDNDRVWLSFGAKYKVSAAGAIDFGLNYLRFRDAPINNIQNNPAAGQANGNVVGTYKGYANIVGVQYTHLF